MATAYGKILDGSKIGSMCCIPVKRFEHDFQGTLEFDPKKSTPLFMKKMGCISNFKFVFWLVGYY